MSIPKIAVILFPGTNSEEETYRAVNAAGIKAEIIRWNSTKGLENYDGYILPGGWSYEDRIRAGIIASKDPLMNIIKAQAKLGKPVLGICNGAQVLVETGMVPALKDKIEMALAKNRYGYRCMWVNLKSVEEKNRTAFTKLFDNDTIIKLPIAHGEGRFTTTDKNLLKELISNKQIIFRYCTPDGKIDETYLTNPNGSMFNIAGVCNKKGNVMAMMPHPERASWFRQVPYFENKPFEEMEKTTLAHKIFQSIKLYIEER
ncbi:MAG: phosphoribosylformylglycinamidine synthase I [Candidatus Woesearchaeota archaeon]